MPVPAILGAMIPSLIATGAGLAAQGVAAGVESQRPENRMTAQEFLQSRGADEAARQAELRAYQQASNVGRSAAKDIGAKAKYMLGGSLGEQAVQGAMYPAFRRALASNMMTARDLDRRNRAAIAQEQAGLRQASKQRQAAVGQVAAMGAKIAGGLSEQGLEGTKLEGLDVGAIGGALQGGVGAIGTSADLNRMRRMDSAGGSSRPLFGGNYGLFGYGY